MKRRVVHVRSKIKGTWNLHYENALSHTAFVVAWTIIAVVPQYPYTLDFVQADYFLFFLLKRTLKSVYL